MKKVFLIFLFFFLFIPNLKAFDNTIKIYDYGQVLSDKQETKIKEKINKYIEQNNKDIVIVTVRHYKFNKLEEYAKEFYKQNEFGLNDSKDGIICVYDLNDNNISIVANGLDSDIYTKKRIDSIYKEIKVKDNNYYKSINKFIELVNKYNSLGVEEVDETVNLINKGLIVLVIILISLFISGIIVLILLLKNRSCNIKNNQLYYIKESTFKINTGNEKMVSTHTIKLK